jgi:hypothetical protein
MRAEKEAHRNVTIVIVRIDRCFFFVDVSMSFDHVQIRVETNK